MISRFIFWVLLLLLIVSTALNVYQIQLFSTEDAVNMEANQSSRSINANNSDRQRFVLEINLDQDGYQTSRSNPFWVKQKLGNILNIEARRFDTLIETFCYYVQSDGIDVKNCIDAVKVWVQPIQDREEAYIAISGKPVDSPGVDVSKICQNTSLSLFQADTFIP